MVYFLSTRFTATLTLLCTLSFFSLGVAGSPEGVFNRLDRFNAIANKTSTIQSITTADAVATPVMPAADAYASSPPAGDSSTGGAGSLQHALESKIVLGAAAVVVYFVL